MSIGLNSIGANAVGAFSSAATNPDVTVGLIGLVATFSQGAVGADVGGDVFVNLTGIDLTITAGDLTVNVNSGTDVSVPLSGIGMTLSTGLLSPRRFGRSGNVVIVPET